MRHTYAACGRDAAGCRRRYLAVKDFKFNSFFAGDPQSSPKLDPVDYRLELSGLIQDKRAWTVEQLHALPAASQVTRHVCVQGWSMVGKWSGPRFGDFLKRVGADLTAKYVGFHCADGYYSSMDMASALHPQTLLAYGMNGRDLPVAHGAPLRVRVERQLGYKSIKFLHRIRVTEQFYDPGKLGPLQNGWAWYIGI